MPEGNFSEKTRRDTPRESRTPAGNPLTTDFETIMDKKAKKRIAVLTKKLSSLRQRLAGARKQLDDPPEVERLGEEITRLESEIERLKSA